MVTYLRKKWRRISAALAVLVMFFIPATRMVLAKKSNSAPPNQNQGEKNNSYNYNKSNHSDHSNCGSVSRPTLSTSKPVSPVSPSSGSTSSSGGSKSWEK